MQLVSFLFHVLFQVYDFSYSPIPSRISYSLFTDTKPHHHRQILRLLEFSPQVWQSRELLFTEISIEWRISTLIIIWCEFHFISWRNFLIWCVCNLASWSSPLSSLKLWLRVVNCFESLSKATSLDWTFAFRSEMSWMILFWPSHRQVSSSCTYVLKSSCGASLDSFLLPLVVNVDTQKNTCTCTMVDMKSRKKKN